MRYFFVSDLHGCHPSLLQNALEQKGFDPRVDTLVVVGDVVDRGLYTMPLIKYLLAIPHAIFLWGNHDRRLREILSGLGHKPDHFDKHNGVQASLHSIAGLESNKLQNIWFYLNVALPDSHDTKDNMRVLDEYWSRCIWAVEFSDLYVTHGWLPYHVYLRDGLMHYAVVVDLTDLPRAEWEEAVWANSYDCVRNRACPSRPLLVGHWWAADIRAHFEQHTTMDDAIKAGIVDFSPFTYNNVTFIDSCTPYSYTINVVIKEYDEDPFVYVNEAQRVVRKHMSEV